MGRSLRGAASAVAVRVGRRARLGEVGRRCCCPRSSPLCVAVVLVVPDVVVPDLASFARPAQVVAADAGLAGAKAKANASKASICAAAKPYDYSDFGRRSREVFGVENLQLKLPGCLAELKDMATSKWSRVAENGSLTTLAAVLYGARDLRIVRPPPSSPLPSDTCLAQEQRPIPPPSSNEVQISVAATTLCGSDAHYFTHGANGSFKVRHPFVLGHEAAGTVVAVGDDVTTVCVGDRVAVECGLACGTCARCKEGRYNLCPSMEFKCVPFPRLRPAAQQVLGPRRRSSPTGTGRSSTA